MLQYECCRLSHFDYVKSEDLERIGMGKPAIRRLVDAVKKRNRKKNLFEKVAFYCYRFKMCYTWTTHFSVLQLYFAYGVYVNWNWYSFAVFDVVAWATGRKCSLLNILLQQLLEVHCWESSLALAYSKTSSTSWVSNRSQASTWCHFWHYYWHVISKNGCLYSKKKGIYYLTKIRSIWICRKVI